MLADSSHSPSNHVAQFSRFEEGEFFKPVLDLLKAKSQSRYACFAESIAIVLDLTFLLLLRSEITVNSVEFMRYLESIARICEQSDSRMEYAIGNQAAQLVSFHLKRKAEL